MKKHKLFFLPVLSALLTLTILCAASQATTQMPSFALESVRDGKIVESNVFDGKVLLLTFFAQNMIAIESNNFDKVDEVVS